MLGVSRAFVGWAALAATPVPMQTTGVSGVLDASGPVRGVGAFVLVSVLGAVLLWRYEPFVDRSIDASIDRPLSSLVYGAAAHLVIAFAGIYLTTRLTQVLVLGRNVGAIGVVAGTLLVVLAAALGFTVVGSAVVELGWARRPWYGLLAGAIVAGAAAFVGSLAGGTVWFVVVSMGIGGPARNWLHDDVVWEE